MFQHAIHAVTIWALNDCNNRPPDVFVTFKQNKIKSVTAWRYVGASLSCSIDPSGVHSEQA